MADVHVIRDLTRIGIRLLIAHSTRKLTTNVHFTNHRPSLVVLDHLKVVVLVGVHENFIVRARVLLEVLCHQNWASTRVT